VTSIDLAQPAHVEISDWLPGACSMTAIGAISAHSLLDATGARAALDRCRTDGRVSIEATDIAHAKQLVAALEAVGYVARVE
jgi:hypothetical protein